MQKSKLKIAIIGAGSSSFGPAMIRDIYLSEALNNSGIDLWLMDICEEYLIERQKYARTVAELLNRAPNVFFTTDLHTALHDADFVITAIEVNRYLHWAQDFHIPRQYGFMQIYGENGGPGGIFHTLRNMEPMVQIARRMEELCPHAVLINFSNPESKLCQAVTMLTKIRTFGLCHGAMDGMKQIASILQIPVEELDAKACGMNHFSWFQTIRRKKIGEDLYPLLREKEKLAEPLAHWDEMALNRICLRVFGLYPSPGANHIGEYIRWANEFLASSALQYYYDPVEGHPWETGKIPQLVYSLSERPTEKPLFSAKKSGETSGKENIINKENLKTSGELAVPIIEALTCGIKHELYAVNVPNKGSIPGIDDDVVVEVPATADVKEIFPQQMERLPEAITALLRVQGSIQKLIVEAYVEKSRHKLLQAILLEPTVNSYRNAVSLINEMYELQKDVLPHTEW